MLLYSIGVVLYVVSFFIPTELAFYSVALSYVIVTYPILLLMIHRIRKQQFLNEFVFMFIATITCFLIGKIYEATFVILLYRIGEFIREKAISVTKASVLSFLKREQDVILLKDGSSVETSQVSIGEILTIEPGKKILVDGIVRNGTTDLDVSALTGELIPKRVTNADEVQAGAINLTNPIEIEVTNALKPSAITKITELANHLEELNTTSTPFFKSLIRFYTPFVLLLTLALLLLPTLFFDGEFHIWGYRALVLLIVACPCVFLLSIPLGYLAGIYASSKKGVIVTGGTYFDFLTKVVNAAFDKTGTLTKGNFKIRDILTTGMEKQEFLEMAAYAVYYSKDPLFSIIKKSYMDEIDDNRIGSFLETEDSGIEVFVDEKKVLFGNASFLKEKGHSVPETNEIGIELYLIVDQHYIGTIVISDCLKDNVCGLANDLRNMGVSKSIILSGDRKDIVEKFGRRLKMDESYGELSSVEKANLIKEKKQEGITFFVGDGVNDAPVLKLADIGIAMGSSGSDEAIQSADIILMKDDPYQVVELMKISKFVKSVIFENLLFSLTIKLLVLLFASLGYVSMGSAIFADVGVTLLCMLNTLRIMRYLN